LKRGDLVTMAVSGDYGKPRPALVIQANAFAVLPSVTVLQLTSDVNDTHLVRITVHPTMTNGLKMVSQIMIDRAMTVPRTKLGPVFGRVDGAVMRSVATGLAAFFGLDQSDAA